jgi:adenine-specific DNA-methyltransferase
VLDVRVEDRRRVTYLRDRLLLARELLTESGSVFVQIGDENVHLARTLTQEIFGVENFVSQIAFRKTAGQTALELAGTLDYILHFAKDRRNLKYRQIYTEKSIEGGSAEKYQYVESEFGARKRISNGFSDDEIAEMGRPFAIDMLVSQRPPGDFPVESFGRSIRPKTGYWKTGEIGFRRLAAANRLIESGSGLMYKRFLSDFAAIPIVNSWSDTSSGASSADPKVYVVQTGPKVVERCLLMTTDPGDLVLDPTCGSGTTAFVAEKWGRRWITCDMSRVAITLAKQRLMTASFDYFALRYPHEGLKGGFV